MAIVFFSYSHKDEDLRNRLESHLSAMKREGLIETWHDRRIAVGDEIGGAIGEGLEHADVILLLVSPDFLDSDYCYGVEMKRAMERNAAGEARVIPVILRACDWHRCPFGDLLAAPTDGKPIKSWPDLDEAFLDVVKKIHAALPSSLQTPHPVPRPTSALSPGPRSSNLRLKKNFTEADKDHFLDAAFEYMGRFFESSLVELRDRNKGIDFKFRHIDANRFTAAIYSDGKALSRCRVMLGGILANGISYSSSDHPDNAGYNECLNVESDDQGMYLKALGFSHISASNGRHLTFEGAAEYYWSMFIEPAQH